MSKDVEIFRRDMGYLKKNQKKILVLKTVISEIKKFIRWDQQKIKHQKESFIELEVSRNFANKQGNSNKNEE